MITVFHNVTITIDNADSPEEAYMVLTESLARAGITNYETFDFTDSLDNFETVHSTDVLMDALVALVAEKLKQHNH